MWMNTTTTTTTTAMETISTVRMEDSSLTSPSPSPSSSSSSAFNGKGSSGIDGDGDRVAAGALLDPELYSALSLGDHRCVLYLLHPLPFYLLISPSTAFHSITLHCIDTLLALRFQVWQRLHQPSHTNGRGRVPCQTRGST